MRRLLLVAGLVSVFLLVWMGGTGVGAATIILGNDSVASSPDRDAAGLAEAFAFSASASDSAQSVSVYVDSDSSASELVAGLYADNAGHPGSLLASGRNSGPDAGQWNQVTLDSTPTLSSGTTYWLAVLGTGGQLNFRDNHLGTGSCSENSSRSDLTSLPSNWTSGTAWSTCSLSAYVTGTESSDTPSAPTDSVLPVISGTAVEGQTLTSSTGSWRGSPTSYSYQWQDCDSLGSNCTNITGATSASYTLTSGDLGDTVDVVVTATNSGGYASAASAQTATVVSSGGGHSGSLPSGVTLQAIDGGPSYFGKFANSLPTSASFYPIAVFNQGLGYNGSSYDPSQLAGYKAVGANTFVNLYNGYNSSLLGAIHADGMYAFTAPLAPGYAGNALAGYVWFDEADGNNRCSDVPSASVLGQSVPCSPTSDGRTPASVISQVNADLHAADPTRAVYCQYTKPVAEDEGLTDAQAAAYVNANCDIVSYDSYVITDGWESNHDLWRQYDDVEHVRSLARASKPVMPFIEAGEPFTSDQWSGVIATPAMSVAEAWNAIIAGARGIQWFDHDFGGSAAGYAQSGDDLIDPNPVFASLQSAVTAFDHRVTSLASILNAPFANGYVTQTGSMNVMAKYDAASNDFYVFAAPRSDSSQSITFTVAGGYSGPVTVQGENRTVTATNGSFTDTFADNTAVHIYIVPNSQ